MPVALCIQNALQDWSSWTCPIQKLIGVLRSGVLLWIAGVTRSNENEWKSHVVLHFKWPSSKRHKIHRNTLLRMAHIPRGACCGRVSSAVEWFNHDSPSLW